MPGSTWQDTTEINEKMDTIIALLQQIASQGSNSDQNNGE